MSDSELVVVLITAPGEQAAERIARALVNERLATCVNLLPVLKSIYRWEGKVREDPEVMLLCKTRRAQVDAIAARVKTLHPYKLPETIALPIVGGSAMYLAWVAGESRPAPE